MTSTTLSGFGLPGDLDFGPAYSSGNPQTFGEPAIFPGGVGYGSVQFVDGKFSTNGAKSTIEVVNVLLGAGVVLWMRWWAARDANETQGRK